MTFLATKNLPEPKRLDHVRPRLQQRSRHLSKTFEACVARLSKELSVRHVHRLRATIRRIESLASFTRPRLSGKEKETLKDLDALRKRAGKVHNLDIQMGLLGSLANGSAARDRRELLQALSQKRQRHAQRLQDSIGKADKQKFRDRVGRLIDSAGAVRAQSRKLDGPDVLDAMPKAIAQLQKLAKEFADRRSLRPKKLHQLRLQLKGIRYVAELSPESPAQAQLIQEIKSVQSAIGEWHDWAGLAQAAEKQFADRVNCPLLVEIQTLLAARYSAATAAVRNLFASVMPAQMPALYKEGQAGKSAVQRRQPKSAGAVHGLARSA